MKIKKQFLMVCAVIPMFCCGIGQKAKAVSQDFDSFTNGTALNSVSGWQAQADYVIRQNTQIDEFSTNAGSLGYPYVVYGSAGYTNSQGVEADFQTSSTGNNLT